MIREGPIRAKFIAIVSLIVLVAGVAVYLLFFHSSEPAAPLQVEYVKSPSVEVLNTPAVIHTVLKTLKYGDRVEIVGNEGNWARVRLNTGNEGWIDTTDDLIPAKTYEDGQKLLHQLSGMQVQAKGNAEVPVNIHLEPGREEPVLAMLSQGQSLEVYNRRIVQRTTASNGSRATASIPISDVWYLVGSGERAGWVLGSMVALDIPEAISSYAANSNVVAWFVLNTVKDGDANVPQYLAADRQGTLEFDFTRVRVFTWSLKRHRYVTSFVRGGLKGVFPIQVQHIDNVPYFRLRLVGDNGSKFQSVFGLFNTIVRPVGTVQGWESTAMPGRAHRGRG